MKQFLTAWVRGLGIFGFYLCLSIVVALFGFLAEKLPPITSIPISIAVGPIAIYWVSRWLAPDLFAEGNPWWRRRVK